MARKNRIPVVHCKNCERELLASDAFCPSCGQENHDHHLSIGAVLYEVVEGFTHFDHKLFNTLKVLFTKPGKLTSDFIAGKRIIHVPPVRLYIFVSVLFFFLLTFGLSNIIENFFTGFNDNITTFKNTIPITKNQYIELQNIKDQPNRILKFKKLISNGDIKIEIDTLENYDEKDTSSIKKDNNSVNINLKNVFFDNYDESKLKKLLSKNALDSIEIKKVEKQDTNQNEIVKFRRNDKIDFYLKYHIKQQFDSLQLNENYRKVSLTTAKKIFDGELSIDSVFKKDKNKSWIKNRLNKGLNINIINLQFMNEIQKKEYIEKISHKFTRNGAFAMYIMMPLSAFFLFILFYRRQKFYFPHLLFSMHLHTFIFICLSVLIVIFFILEKLDFNADDTLILLLLFYLGIYFYYYKAQKHFYKTSNLKTLVEGGIVATFYFLAFFMLAAVVFVGIFV